MAILLVTFTEKNPKTGRVETRVSHGVDLGTDRPVVTDNETIDVYERMGARFDKDMGEWVLPSPRRVAA
jgi:hypothetical protein